MSRTTVSTVVAWLCLCLFVPCAAACINDRESAQAEKEFKSRYLEQQPRTEPLPNTTPPPSNLLTVSVVGLGAVLLIGAMLITVRPRRPRI